MKILSTFFFIFGIADSKNTVIRNICISRLDMQYDGHIIKTDKDNYLPNIYWFFLTDQLFQQECL